MVYSTGWNMEGKSHYYITQCPSLKGKSDLTNVLFKLQVREAQKIISLLPLPHTPLPPNLFPTLSYRPIFLVYCKKFHT